MLAKRALFAIEGVLPMACRWVGEQAGQLAGEWAKERALKELCGRALLFLS